MKKLLLPIALLFSTFTIRAQYNEHFMFNPVPKDTIEKIQLESTKIEYHEGTNYITWNVKGDTVEGLYLVFKSKNYSHYKLISSVNVYDGLFPNISLAYYIEDKFPNEIGYNYYHIVKVPKSLTFSELENIRHYIVEDLRNPCCDVAIIN